MSQLLSIRTRTDNENYTSVHIVARRQVRERAAYFVEGLINTLSVWDCLFFWISCLSSKFSKRKKTSCWYMYRSPFQFIKENLLALSSLQEGSLVRVQAKFWQNSYHHTWSLPGALVAKIFLNLHKLACSQASFHHSPGVNSIILKH